MYSTITHLYNGLFCEARSLNELAKWITKLYSNERLYKRLQHNAFNSSSRYRIEHQCERWQQLYTTGICMRNNGKIAILLPSFHGGGAEKMLLNLGSQLLEDGVDVDIIVIKNEGPYSNHVSNDCNLIDIECSRTLTSIPKICEYLKHNEPDSILSTLRVPNLANILSKITSQTTSQSVIRVSNMHSYKKRSGLKPKVINSAIKKLYSKSDQIIAISEGVKSDLVNNYNIQRDNISVIHNPAYSEEILKLRSEETDHEWLDNKTSPVIMAAGRLVRQKNFSLLLHSFNKIIDKKDARLIILGEGPLREELEDLSCHLGISKKVSMPGFVENPYSFMYNSDVFVLSSRYEGFGNVLVEAMACECKIVSTDCPGGPSEILSGGQHGRLVPVGDPDMLSEAISNSLDEQNPSEYQDRLQDFNVDKITKKYKEVLL